MRRKISGNKSSDVTRFSLVTDNLNLKLNTNMIITYGGNRYQEKMHYLSRKQANLLRIMATATLTSAIAKFIPIQFLWRLKKQIWICSLNLGRKYGFVWKGKQQKQNKFTILWYCSLCCTKPAANTAVSLLAAGDVSRERRLRSHKFYTDDVDLSGIWSTSANVPSGDEREETAVFEGYVVQYFPKWMVVPKAFYQ